MKKNHYDLAETHFTIDALERIRAGVSLNDLMKDRAIALEKAQKRIDGIEYNIGVKLGNLPVSPKSVNSMDQLRKKVDLPPRFDPASNVLHAVPEAPTASDPAPVARKKVFGNKGPMPDLARKIGKTSNVLSYVPLPSTLRAVWKDLSDAATGKTPQDHIKKHEASIRDANARIALIDKKITALENEIREISDRNKKTPAPYLADRRPFLEKQIRILEAQRGALEENIRQLQEGIIEESAKQLDTINKPYVDRSNPVQT